MSLPGGVFNEDYGRDTAIIRTKTQWVIFIGFLILMLCFPLFGSEYWIYTLNLIGITIISVLGLQLLMGYCGQISIGHSAFMAVGAYTSGILSVKLQIPFLLAFPLAGLSAGCVGLLFGIPALRIKDLYLALATMASQFILGWVFVHWKDMTGGTVGLNIVPISIGSFQLIHDYQVYYAMLVVLLSAAFFAKRLVMSDIGRVWMAIRDNDLAAEAMGINVFRYKLLAFFIGCFYAGIGGSLWSHYTGIVIPDQYTFLDSIWYTAMIIIGGAETSTGTFIGVGLVTLLKTLSFRLAIMIGRELPAVYNVIGAALPLLVIGLVFAGILIWEPRGLYHRWRLFQMSYRIWPYSY